MICRCCRHLYNWKVQPARLQQQANNPGLEIPRVERLYTQSANLGATQYQSTVTAQCKSASCLIDVKPTLSQVWKQDELISAICVQSVDVHVSCSLHGISELAPFFIDP